jgi:hypothetical protein
MRDRRATTAGPSAAAWITRWLVAGPAATVTDEGQQGMQEEAAIMAPAKETGRARQKGSTGRVDSGHGRRTVAEEIGRGGEPAMVEVDPWGAFFEDFWGEGEAAGSGSADRPDGGREPAKGIRTKGTKLGR